jgi:4-diphosphocytidyl-2C-methyl-D-erythritol kinase
MMYAALKPEHYTDGGRTAKVAARIRAGQAVREEDVYNVFERIRSPGDWGVETTNGSTLHTGHMCGSGPTLCFVATSDEEAKLIARGVPSTLNMRAIATHTAGSAVTTTIEELD